MKRKEILERLDQAIEILYPMRGNMEDDGSLETSHALGKALGMLVKARVLVKRDLEGAKCQKPSA
jgi:hypothetical protein